MLLIIGYWGFIFVIVARVFGWMRVVCRTRWLFVVLNMDRGQLPTALRKVCLSLTPFVSANQLLKSVLSCCRGLPVFMRCITQNERAGCYGMSLAFDIRFELSIRAWQEAKEAANNEQRSLR